MGAKSVDPARAPAGFELVRIGPPTQGINVAHGGTGRAVVLLHGWPGSWYSWHQLMPLLPGYHLIVPDLPGFGDSDAPPKTDALHIAGLLWEAIDRLATGPVTVVGHDMGFLPAYAMAATQRSRVSHLVAVDTALPGFGIATGDASDLLLPTRERNLWHVPFFMACDEAAALCEGREELLLRLTAGPAYAEPTRFRQDMVAELARGLRRPGNLRAGFSYYASWFETAEQNQRLAASPLSIPVLAVAGAASPLQYVIEASVRGVANNVVSVVVPEAGHFIAEEQPHRLANALRAFLENPSNRSDSMFVT